MDADFLRDLFSSFRPVVVRRMFGGAGIYADGVMFALIADEIIYLKVDDETVGAFEQEGLAPFTYSKKPDQQAVMSYRRMPDRCYDDPDEMALWAARAFEAASRKKAVPKKRVSKRKPTAKRRRLTRR